jgi:thiamine biosynthesis lipoprotein
MVVTSGGYQRFFESDGTTYHHILDPKTGFPAESGLTSVTIVSDDGTAADGLSTALFVMGKDAAIDFWRAHRELFDAVLVTSETEVLVTAGISDAYSSDRDFEVIAP